MWRCERPVLDDPERTGTGGDGRRSSRPEEGPHSRHRGQTSGSVYQGSEGQKRCALVATAGSSHDGPSEGVERMRDARVAISTGGYTEEGETEAAEDASNAAPRCSTIASGVMHAVCQGGSAEARHSRPETRHPRARMPSPAGASDGRCATRSTTVRGVLESSDRR